MTGGTEGLPTQDSAHGAAFALLSVRLVQVHISVDGERGFQPIVNAVRIPAKADSRSEAT